MSRPRILAIMGSGETAPTMTKVHRSLFAMMGEGSVPAVFLDTPFGFQANADELTERTITYFKESVDRAMGVASFRRASDADALDVERLRLQLRDAKLVFAGPGSPSYALRQWAGSPIPGELADKLRTGGCVTFSSAAALTLGVSTVPVYEVYKVGADPEWLPGLDLTAATGLSMAVIPHYDNAEGGTHDTRFCYLGEGRLRMLEGELKAGAFVLGVDEHTAAIFDLSASTMSVLGRGGVTVRADGRSEVLATGTVMSIEQVNEIAGRLRASGPAAGPGSGFAGAGTGSGSAGAGTGSGFAGAGTGSGFAGAGTGEAGLDGTGAGEAAAASGAGGSPLLEAIVALEGEFDAALAQRDANAAVRCALALEQELHAWSSDTLQSDEADRGRALLRGMIVRLGEAAQDGVRDPRAVLGPWIDALLVLRASAREAKRWSDADEVRDHLLALGVEVRDDSAGTTWELAPH